MRAERLSASSYSNTAPLIWSFIYGQNRGKYELILDNAPARSAELLAQDKVDFALVPIVAYQEIEGVKLVSDVCIGARQSVGSVCIITNGCELQNARKVALDISSKTSAVLTKIIFLEFLGFEPEWMVFKPDPKEMLEKADAALIIGDPALMIQDCKKFDLAKLWHDFTGLGFVFAMWMTKRDSCSIDFASARDEGLEHLEEIVSNYQGIGLSREEFISYLENIAYEVEDSMLKGLELYFRLARKHGFTSRNRRIEFIGM
ncbi:MAG: menaquinone biosynthesis protein [Pyrinomonadaceae bacterium]|nr:menaquinone biosynthesis protein [Pyrinomonadaceae bacterium]MCX7638847.1 menaquinone biosynthesis protein [Pyrinomonadaceae bacterium]MDW8305017.1 menaquinone biosynthesis protein [Acidobacteriota bacterium]